MAATDSVTTGSSGRLAVVRELLPPAAARVDRSPAAITLVAVSKRFDADAVQRVHELGQHDFGESRAQELVAKAPHVTGARWHFVGRLQRNKVSRVVGTAGLIHSVDRLELAAAIGARAREQQRVQPVLVQVNVGDDPAKGGCAVNEAAELIAELRQLDGVSCQGLMTIPPLEADPRPLFADLRALRDDVRQAYPEVQHLSMGMSQDFEVAIEEGATIVRVGEAIFGPRPTR
ncbi:MAG: YggS family pyridoxal phosphate-dependent enzyme [Egibacteraceae bacterium]